MDRPISSNPEIPKTTMMILPRRASAAHRLARLPESILAGNPPVVLKLYPRNDINPIKIKMAPAQKKPSLYWAEVSHPRIKLMIDTMTAEMSERSEAPIARRRMVFFMVLVIRLYSGQLVAGLFCSRSALGIPVVRPSTQPPAWIWLQGISLPFERLLFKLWIVTVNPLVDRVERISTAVF